MTDAQGTPKSPGADVALPKRQLLSGTSAKGIGVAWDDVSPCWVELLAIEVLVAAGAAQAKGE